MKTREKAVNKVLNKEGSRIAKELFDFQTLKRKRSMGNFLFAAWLVSTLLCIMYSENLIPTKLQIRDDRGRLRLKFIFESEEQEINVDTREEFAEVKEEKESKPVIVEFDKSKKEVKKKKVGKREKDKETVKYVWEEVV